MAKDEFRGGDGRFPATRRSIIEGARSVDVDERKRALDKLCETYWKPVYKYVRLRWERDTVEAQDLTQGFFAEMLERELLNRFDAGKSRLRTYLRLCVDSFVMNQDKAARRQKRGGDVQHLAFDFGGAEEELGGAAIDPAAIASPESLEEFFEKEWVRSLFTLAVEDLRALCVERGSERAFQFFEVYDLECDGKVSYGDLANQFGIPVTDVNNGLAWARREFRRIALERLREICGSEEEFHRECKATFGWNSK
jgi:DNA-directed RNA polymerase specialized sigma24 family protein